MLGLLERPRLRAGALLGINGTTLRKKLRGLGLSVAGYASAP
jgi:DNA-binding protein Fis